VSHIIIGFYIILGGRVVGRIICEDDYVGDSED